MCGRFVSTKAPKQIADEFDAKLEDESQEYFPNFNVAPTNKIWVVSEPETEKVVEHLKWGLVPSWAKDPAIGNKLINARAEGIDAKPSFRSAFKSRRCLIPVDGFYEWKRVGSRKQPYYFSSPEDSTLVFAGLWERWKDENGRTVKTCTVITTSANDLMRLVHDRMPVLLPSIYWDTWLSHDSRPDELLELLKPAPQGVLVSHPVSTQVNNSRNAGAQLIDEISVDEVLMD